MSLPLKKFIIATKNKNKVVEIKAILNLPKNFKIYSLLDFQEIPKILETGKTYLENAKIKATIIYKEFKIPVLAEDSGIEFLSLGNFPGIYSSRFLGEKTNYKIKNDFVLQTFKYLPPNLRKCQYVCSAVFVINSKQIFYSSGKCIGVVAKKPAGKNGFGYDPIFYLSSYKKTIAQISAKLKNKISHRAKAIKKIKKFIFYF